MAVDFVAGCLGGCAGVAIGHPFDTIKVKLQTQDYKNPVYRGTWDCFTKILKNESVAGLYRGIWPPMAGVALVNAIVFGVYGNLQRNFSQPESLQTHFMAGASAGLAQSIISSPVELIKTRMQISSHYSSIKDCFLDIFKRQGVRGVFKGLKITGLREFFGYGSYFATYEALTFNSSEQTPVGTPMMMLAGGISGSISWILTYPVDVVKSRFQADNGAYSGIFDCLKKSVQNEGVACLTRGLIPTIIRAFPSNAVTFTIVTWVIRAGDIIENKSLCIDDIIGPVLENFTKQNYIINNVEVLGDTPHRIKVNIFKNEPQKYFLMSEDLWVNDEFEEFSNEMDNGNSQIHEQNFQKIEDLLEVDLQVAELKKFGDNTLGFVENHCDVDSKCVQTKDEYKNHLDDI